MSMTILQMIIDEVESHAKANAHGWRDVNEYTDLAEWPDGADDEEKENERRAVVRALFALLGRSP